MYQKTIVIGNLGRNPEMVYLPDGTAVTKFSVATSSHWTDKATGQPKEETTWFRVSVFGRQAETVHQFLSKGSKVLVEGQLKPNPDTGGPTVWTNKEGIVSASFELKADVVRFLSGKSESGNGDTSNSTENRATAIEEDDVPF